MEENMTRLTTITLIAGLIVLTSLASALDIGGGPKAGLNIADLHGEDVDDSDPRIGFSVGGYVDIALSDMISIQPEVFYSQQGATWVVPWYVNIVATAMLDYIDMPVLLKLSWSSPGTARINMAAGPYLGFNLKASTKVEAGTVALEQTDIETVKDTDIGVIFGLGVDFGIGTGKGVFDLRYMLSFNSVDEEYDVRNGVFSIMLGYMF
jgi:hypothetical protein